MKKLKIYILIGAVVVAGAIFFRTGFSSSIVWNLSQSGQWLLPLVIITALVDSVNPCAFSILLLTIAFLFSIGRLRSDILKLGIFYILGIFLAYFLIGLGLVQVLHIFNTPHFMAKIGAILLIVLGAVNLIGYFFPRFPIKLRISQAAHHQMARLMEKGSLVGIFALGGLVGLCEFPCTGGPYLAVIGLLHDQATYLRGVSYLLFYNLIFVLPLIFILLMASHRILLEKVRNWQMQKGAAMRWGGGVAMIVLGLLILIL